MSAVHSTEAQAALCRFTELTREDVEYAGGKGANLGELTQAGVPVPLGFVVGAPGPSVYPEYTGLLVRAGIDAISVTVDAFDRTRRLVAAAEQRVLLEAARRSDHVNEEAPHGARVHRRL